MRLREKRETGHWKVETGGAGLAKAQGPQSELVVAAGKVAAGTATEAEKARFQKMAAGA